MDNRDSNILPFVRNASSFELIDWLTKILRDQKETPKLLINTEFPEKKLYYLINEINRQQGVLLDKVNEALVEMLVSVHPKPGNIAFIKSLLFTIAYSKPIQFKDVLFRLVIQEKFAALNEENSDQEMAIHFLLIDSIMMLDMVSQKYLPNYFREKMSQKFNSSYLKRALKFNSLTSSNYYEYLRGILDVYGDPNYQNLHFFQIITSSLDEKIFEDKSYLQLWLWIIDIASEFHSRPFFPTLIEHLSAWSENHMTCNTWNAYIEMFHDIVSDNLNFQSIPAEIYSRCSKYLRLSLRHEDIILWVRFLYHRLNDFKSLKIPNDYESSLTCYIDNGECDLVHNIKDKGFTNYLISEPDIILILDKALNEDSCNQPNSVDYEIFPAPGSSN